MNKKLIVGYITQNDSNWLKYSLESIESIADKIIIVDGGSETRHLNKMNGFIDGNEKYLVINNPFPGNNGAQYKVLLEEIMKHKTSNEDWCLIIDSDEVIDDNSHLLKEYMDNKDGKNIYSIRMNHCVNDLRHVDATMAGAPRFAPDYIHHVLGRFFKLKDNIFFPTTEHTIIQGFSELEQGIIDDVVLWHYGKCKNMYDLKCKFEMNLQRSNMHNKTFLTWWFNSFRDGKYPVRELVSLQDHPSVIKREFYIKDDKK